MLRLCHSLQPPSVDCAAGSYLSVPTNSCLPCEQGFYRDKSSPTQVTCVQCPEDFITLFTGSDQASDCISKEKPLRNLTVLFSLYQF